MLLAIVFGVAALLFAVELARPGRAWPRVAGWWGRAALLNAAQIGIAVVAGSLWEPWLARVRPWSADGLGTTGGALVGYLAITFVYYWWHRWRHTVPGLWRWLHQVHHSPARIEILTSFYKHPLEILANSLLSATILFVVLGVSPAAGAQAILLTGLAELFYHWNVRTPYWLGFLVQRPEMHCIHHQRGHHAQNFGDLPLWDMLFGTFHNPRAWQGECGFGDDAERRLGAMLGGEVVA